MKYCLQCNEKLENGSYVTTYLSARSTSTVDIHPGHCLQKAREEEEEAYLMGLEEEEEEADLFDLEEVVFGESE